SPKPAARRAASGGNCDKSQLRQRRNSCSACIVGNRSGSDRKLRSLWGNGDVDMIRRVARARSWPPLVRGVIVTLAVLAATALQLPIETEVPGEPFVLYLLVVGLSAGAFGRIPAYVAVAETTMASFLYFPPMFSFRLIHAIDLVAIEIYAAMA